MATITHLDWLDGMLGDPTHSVVDFNADTIKISLLDEADAGSILESFVDYDEVNAADVTYSTELTIAAITNGVVTIDAPTTMSGVSGDVSEFITIWKDNASDAATSPLIITWDDASSGLPVTPNTGDIIATFGSNEIVTLA